MFQYYIVEIQKNASEEFSHLVHYAWDEDSVKARLKGESKYYEVLSAAAISELPLHSAIMFGTDGVPVMYNCYLHETNAEPEQEVETPVEPTPDPEPDPA